MLPKHLRWTAEGQLPVGRTAVRELSADQIRVVFQPIVDARTGALFAHEVLVRCTLPEFLSPPVLFEHAVAEQATGRLGRLIRDTAFALCSETALFVNIHPDELSERWLVQADDPMGFHAHPVYLEITETGAFTHFELCNSILKEVCARTGAKLVIDDFGAGHSNLQRLMELDPAVVKFDLALIRDVDKSTKKQAMVRHMQALCRELGAKVVAEGVETDAELQCLQSLGVDFVQGYLLARPANPPPPIRWPEGVLLPGPERWVAQADRRLAPPPFPPGHRPRGERS